MTPDVLLPSFMRTTLIAAAMAAGVGCSCEPGEGEPEPAVPVSVSFAAESSMVEEGAGTAAIALVIATDGRPTDRELTVTVQLANEETASLGLDFGFDPENVTIRSGTSSGSELALEIPITTDLSVEDTESFTVELADGDDLDIESPDRHTVFIVDDDRSRLLGAGPYLAEIGLDGTTSFIGSSGLAGIQEAEAIGYDSISARFYAIDNETATLWSIAPSGSPWSRVASLAFAEYRALTIDDRGMVWAVTRFEDVLYRIDPATGLFERVGEPLNIPGSLECLAFDDVSGLLYAGAPRGAAGELYRIDPETAEITSIGALDEAIRGCAIDPASGVAYGARDRVLVEIDLVTAEITLIGLMELPVVGLTVSPEPGVLIGVSATELQRINAMTAESSSAGTIGIDFVALAPGREPGTYFGMSVRDDLFVFDPSTGVVDIIRRYPEPRTDIQSLAYDPQSDRLYGWDRDINDLVLIDSSSGELTPLDIRTSLQYRPQAIAFDSTSGELYASNGVELARIDLESQEAVILPTAEPVPNVLAFDSEGNLFGMADRTLVGIDQSTGSQTVIREYFSHANALDYDPASGLLIAGRGASLVHLDPTNGLRSSIDGLLEPGSLAIDETRGLIYTGFGSFLGVVDPATGRSRETTRLEGFDIDGLAHDPATGLLFAADNGLSGAGFAIIDPVQETLEVKGELGVNNVNDIAYDPDRRVLYGTSSFSSSLLTIDISTGAGTLSPNPYSVTTTITSIAVLPDGRLVATDSDQRLLEIDRATGVATPIGRIAARIRALDYQQ